MCACMFCADNLCVHVLCRQFVCACFVQTICVCMFCSDNLSVDVLCRQFVCACFVRTICVSMFVHVLSCCVFTWQCLHKPVGPTISTERTPFKPLPGNDQPSEENTNTTINLFSNRGCNQGDNLCVHVLCMFCELCSHGNLSCLWSSKHLQCAGTTIPAWQHRFPSAQRS